MERQANISANLTNVLVAEWKQVPAMFQHLVESLPRRVEVDMLQELLHLHLSHLADALIQSDLQIIIIKAIVLFTQDQHY
jgi:hypothetical protein